MAKSTPYKGNKTNLPSKLCMQCGRIMTWRKAWAKNWHEVKYCSDACRGNSKTKSVATRSLKPFHAL